MIYPGRNLVVARVEEGGVHVDAPDVLHPARPTPIMRRRRAGEEEEHVTRQEMEADGGDAPAARVQVFHPGGVSQGQPEVSRVQHVSMATFEQEPERIVVIGDFPLLTFLRPQTPAQDLHDGAGTVSGGEQRRHHLLALRGTTFHILSRVSKARPQGTRPRLTSPDASSTSEI